MTGWHFHFCPLMIWVATSEKTKSNLKITGERTLTRRSPCQRWWESRISDYCLLRVAVQTGLLWLHSTHDRQSCRIRRIWKIRSELYIRDSFRIIYSGFVNGIQIPTDRVQHARLTRTTETNGINGASNLTNEEGWIEVKKVTFKEQDQFGKTKRFWQDW